MISAIMNKRQVHLVQIDEENIEWIDGKPIIEQDKIIQITGSIQPLSNDEKSMLPEGEQQILHYNIYTQHKIKLNDLIIFDGEEFQVQVGVEQWSGGSIKFYKGRMIQLVYNGCGGIH